MIPKPEIHQHKTHIKTLIDAALSAVDPARRIDLHIERIGEMIDRHQKCWVVGAGKASLEMVLALNGQLGDCLVGWAIAVVPERLLQLDEVKRSRLPFQLYPASHPLPTEQNIEAAKAIANIAHQAGKDDLLLVLISGGGSSHLALPIERLRLLEYQEVTNQLLRAGATIQELNAVRKHSEQLKGGGLLRLAAPAQIYALILSDVIGDSLAVIASGPVSADPTTFKDAYNILMKYDIEVSPVFQNHLEAGIRGEYPETLKENDPLLKHVMHSIIGSNLLAVEAGVEGEAREIGEHLGALAHQMKQQGDLPGIAILGGETTVTVSGNGRGAESRNDLVCCPGN